MNGKDHWAANPYLAYAEKGQAEAYLRVMKNPAYYDSFHGPFRDLICANAGLIADRLGTSGNAHFFDLGPGYPDKSLPVLEELTRRQARYAYYPFDVNADFLDLARDAVRPLTDAIFPILGLFEEADTLTRNIPLFAEDRSLVFLGLTFMNFEPAQLKQIFTGFARFSPVVLVGARIRAENESVDKLAEAYRNAETDEFAFGPLRQQGMKREFFAFEVAANQNRVETWYEVKVPFVLKEKTYQSGERFLTAISHRYSRREFVEVLQQVFGRSEPFFTPDERQSFALGFGLSPNSLTVPA